MSISVVINVVFQGQDMTCTWDRSIESLQWKVEEKYQNHELKMWKVLLWSHYYSPLTNDNRGFIHREPIIIVDFFTVNQYLSWIYSPWINNYRGFIHIEPIIIVYFVWTVLHQEIKNMGNYLEDYRIVFEYLPTSVVHLMVVN